MVRRYSVDFLRYSLRRDHSALLDRAIEAYDRGAGIEEDLRKHREEQWVKMREVHVSRRRSTVDVFKVLNELFNRSS